MDKQWIIEQNDFDTRSVIKHNESLFTLGNGYLGLRGDMIYQNKAVQSGSYINGFYEKGPIIYGEKAYGFAENWQTMISIPEGKDLRISVGGKKLFHKGGHFLENRRFLNMKESCSIWEFIWANEDSDIFKGSLTTIVPFSFNGSAVFIWNIELPREDLEVEIASVLYYAGINDSNSDDPRISAHFNGESISVEVEKQLIIKANGSDLTLVCDMGHQTRGIISEKCIRSSLDNGFKDIITGRAGKSIVITKTVSYSYDKSMNKSNTGTAVGHELKKIMNIGFEKILDEQRSFMANFWDRSDVVIQGDDDAMLSLRFNMFQLLQSTGRDGKRSIAAKGLSGPGYEGHYFWDAETYVLPFFIYTNPEVARSMLLYRISIIEKAGGRAKVLGHNGILFPWRTINGEESSAYFPAGTAQYHINADISLGLVKYLEVTGDSSILDVGGSDLLSGTADFWCSLASDIPNKGICFNLVTGPDEYTALVNNNYYTNLTAKENLLMAALWLKDRISKDKIQKWKRIADRIYLPTGKEITPQDDSFFGKEVWDFKNTKKSQYPLLLNFHPLNIYRKQVLKQADVVMAQALHRSHFPPGLIKRNFDYYEKLTTRDSSLSACAQGICALWLGYDELCWDYFLETVHTDMKDLHNNVFHGLHTASMGGAYLMIINGFIGLENYNNSVRFRPKLPKNLKSINLNIMLRGRTINIFLEKETITYTAFNGSISFYHFSDVIFLDKNEIKVLKVKPNIKLEIDDIDNNNLYSMEEEIFNIVNYNKVLPEETVIITRDEAKGESYNILGYNC